MSLFYVGTPGRMVALPDIYSDVAVGDTRLGGSSSSLHGRQWRDTLGHERTWAWKWSNLLPHHVPHVRALAHGLVRGPLRLIDPHETNRLPEQVATGGSVSRSTKGFAVTAGGLTYRDLLTISADPATLPPAALLRGCQEWQRPTGGTGTCFLTGDTADGTWRLPLVPGEHLEVSCWVAGQAGVVVEARWAEYELDDTVRSYFRTGAGSEEVALSSTVWQRLSLPVDPTTRTTVSMTPRLSVPSSTAPSGPVFHTAWQVAAVGAEDLDPGWSGDCLPDGPDPYAGFRVGGGAPFVVADPDSATYRRAKARDLGLLLTETTP